VRLVETYYFHKKKQKSYWNDILFEKRYRLLVFTISKSLIKIYITNLTVLNKID